MKKEFRWTTEGFEAFRSGEFGNGGQNLYVSKKGVLQRIFQYDLDRDGYFDLLFCCSQNHCESAPVFVFDGKVRTELPARGAIAGIATDLTGDGYDDLVVAMKYDGMSVVLNSAVYYGSPDGFSERRMNLLPTPWCEGVAAGNFDGRGKSLAFICRGKVRIFPAGELGVEARRFLDWGVGATQLAAGDLDGDGFDELAVRNADGETLIFWGSAEGISEKNFTKLDFNCVKAADLEAALRKQSDFERTEEPEPRMQMVAPYGGKTYLSAISDGQIRFFSADLQHHFRECCRIDAPDAQSVAFGSLVAPGQVDLVVAARSPRGEGECSYFFPGGAKEFEFGAPLEMPTYRACDACIADWNGDGQMELVICQSHTPTSFSCKSLLFDGFKKDFVPVPDEISCEDSRNVLAPCRPGRPPLLALVNHYSRSLVGHDKVKLFHGGPDGFNSERFTELPGWCAVEGLYVDINDDGIGDLVVVNCAENSLWLDPGSYIHINGENGFDPAKRITLPTRGAHGCVCGDLNHNGYLDLVFTSFSDPNITIFHGGPDGLDLEHPTKIPLIYKGKSYPQPRWIYLADLNRDGYLDLIIPQITLDRSFILWGGPDGFSFDRCQELAVWRASCVRAADLSGNGYLDLVIGGHMPSSACTEKNILEPHESYVYIYWNGPDGICENNRTQLRADGVNSMTIADFNQDGMLDLFVGSYHNGEERDIDSFLYWNRKGIGFRNADVTRLRTHSVSGCLAADFNGDGRVDLAVANHKVYGDHTAYSTIWWNGADGFDPKNVTNLATSGPHGITAVEPGNQLDRKDGEYYTSSAQQLSEEMAFWKWDYQGDTPVKTWVRCRIRSANSPDLLEDATWSDWLLPEVLSERVFSAGIWVQYQLELGAENSLRTPRITRVELMFLPL